MNENAPRSVCLVILMIAAVALPLMQTGPPPELEVKPAKEEVAAATREKQKVQRKLCQIEVWKANVKWRQGDEFMKWLERGASGCSVVAYCFVAQPCRTCGTLRLPRKL